MKQFFKSKVFIIVPIIVVAIIAGLVFIPVKTSDAACGEGQRYSIILGQLDAYEQAAREASSATYLLACPTYIHDDVPNALYVL